MKTLTAFFSEKALTTSLSLQTKLLQSVGKNLYVAPLPTSPINDNVILKTPNAQCSKAKSLSKIGSKALSVFFSNKN